MFSTLPKTNFNVLVIFILSSANDFILNQSKMLSFGKELGVLQIRGSHGSESDSAVNESVLSQTVYIVGTHKNCPDKTVQRTRKIGFNRYNC